MAIDFSAALRAEIAALEAALEADLRFKRLNELRKVLDLYPPTPQGGGGEDIVADSNGAKFTVRRRVSPERAKAMEVARLFLQNRVGPTSTREIYDHLIGLGLSVPGEVPINNLSAMLSNSEEFLSQGRVGWTLRGTEDIVPETTLRNVSEIVLADLETEEIRDIFRGLIRHQGIPPEVDGRLLSRVRAEVKRDLTENEKRDLRAVFRDMVEASLSSADRVAITGREDE